MKNLLFIFLALFSIKSFAQNDYRIQINGKTMEIALDQEYKINVNKNEIKFKIIAKDTLFYENELFSFKYPKDFKIQKTNLDGVEQIMLMTAAGSGLIIQTHRLLNPSNLNEMMMAEFTKESLNYGYKSTRDEYTKKIKSGQKIKVIKETLNYNDETNIYEVSSIGDKDQGIMIMTSVFGEEDKLWKKLIDMFWETIIYKNKN